MIEKTQRLEGRVLVEAEVVRPGQNRLARGREIRAGDVVLRRGGRLNAARDRPAGLGRPDRGRRRPPAQGRRRPDGRRAGRARPRPRPRPDPQLERRRCSGRWSLGGGADAEALPIAPDEPGPLAEVLGRGLAADVLLITGGVSAGDARPRPRDARTARRRTRLPQGPAQARQAPLVRRRPAAERRPRTARLRPARQPGQRHRRLPPLRPARPRRPRREDGRRARRSPRIACSGPAPTSATGRPITPRGWSRPATARPSSRSTGPARPTSGPSPGPTASPSSRKATAPSTRVKLSDSCPSGKM